MPVGFVDVILRCFEPFLREKLGMRATAHEYHQATLARIVEDIDQKEVAADVALAMTSPVTHQWVIEPFRR